MHRATFPLGPLPPNTDGLSEAACGSPTVVTRGRTRLSQLTSRSFRQPLGPPHLPASSRADTTLSTSDGPVPATEMA